MDILMKPIGYIQSPFKEKKHIPKQATISEGISASIQLLNEYEVGIEDIHEGSYGIILFYFHESEGYSLKTISHKTGKMRGIFSTRSPNRPNGIGFSIVKFTKIHGTTIEFQGVDMIDGTPVLDIKPYDEELNPKI
ncbi:tRNA (N6-threonylcarbamoyladenosine(37)-N6)-methyltransferase TrmO [Alkalibaculum sp. M08DMB]|uniref:tRNA (N6-threonylcarbamoyladenosine(37)-N6)-methyltransferase TrmO n=1 Tax=Alkalibaculum sporogenes TaxID=2655001 RepID=A0A6A7K6D8_9FIRM|nr:tRNA (N6-threonylcarbamoyladenosine(37)-N6)-methyltransferase TrmO [Alkalibaculum sporogenes]MPW24952.1 tRNA (N6-threonylcarbamoyladenosine(37)-N6)-methyltransferase TrmO [Alkalibaculum sporogenes]